MANVEEEMGDRSLDAMILPFTPTQPGDGAYLSGHLPWARLAYLVLGGTRETPILITTMASEAYWAAEQLDGLIEVQLVADDIAVSLADAVGRGVSRVGLSQFASARWSEDLSKIAEDSQLIDATSLIQSIRSIKSEAEVAAMVAGCHLAQEAFISVTTRYRHEDRQAVSEAEFFAGIDHYLRSAGARQTHLLTSDRAYLRPPALEITVQDSQLISVEFSAESGYWVEDGTTLINDDRGTSAAEAYRVCEEGLEQVLEVLRPGVLCSEVVSTFERAIDQSGWRLGIWLGHGIGLDIAEKPFLRADSDDQIQAGMVLAVHPHVVSEDGHRGAYLSRTVLIEDETVTMLGYEQGKGEE